MADGYTVCGYRDRIVFDPMNPVRFLEQYDFERLSLELRTFRN